MLTIPQIEALRKTNPQLYEALKRLAGASLGPIRAGASTTRSPTARITRAWPQAR